MQESIKAALSYVRSKAPEFGIQPNAFETKDIHIHVPEGATPKDGPSAGVAMITSLGICAYWYPGSPRCGNDGRD